jgi:hypothetical protein
MKALAFAIVVFPLLAVDLAPLLAQAEPAVAPAVAPAVDPTPADLADAAAKKAWPLFGAIAIFLLAKLVTALGWVTSKGGKLVLVLALAGASGAVDALAMGQHWALALLAAVTTALAAIGINSGGKNALQATLR